MAEQLRKPFCLLCITRTVQHREVSHRKKGAWLSSCVSLFACRLFPALCSFQDDTKERIVTALSSASM